MTTEQKTTKAFITAENKAHVVCPFCAHAATIKVQVDKKHKHIFKVKCKCTKTFPLQLEFRRQYRKPTELPGSYELEDTTTGDNTIQVIDLSLRGACFEVTGVHDIKPGQKGTINFTLTNRKQTVLEKNVVIISVSGKRIGCKFIDEIAFDSDLGFFVRP